jgi:hypothetical protein
MVACTTPLEGNNEYLVAIGSLDENFTLEKEYKVTSDPLEQTSTCGCGQFGRIGILCYHALKVLDLMNIKSLPKQYVLKCWTCEARSGIIQDSEGRLTFYKTNASSSLSFLTPFRVVCRLCSCGLQLQLDALVLHLISPPHSMGPR